MVEVIYFFSRLCLDEQNFAVCVALKDVINMEKIVKKDKDTNVVPAKRYLQIEVEPAVVVVNYLMSLGREA